MTIITRARRKNQKRHDKENNPHHHLKREGKGIEASLKFQNSKITNISISKMNQNTQKMIEKMRRNSNKIGSTTTTSQKVNIRTLHRGEIIKPIQQQTRKQSRINIINNATTNVKEFFCNETTMRNMTRILHRPYQTQKIDNYHQTLGKEDANREIEREEIENEKMVDEENASKESSEKMVDEISTKKKKTSTFSHLPKHVADKFLIFEPYVFDNQRYMLSIEQSYLPSQNYILNDDHLVSHRYRTILIDWLFTIHQHYCFCEATLHLTINLLDRYLALENVGKSRLQCVASGCFVIAAKYHELFEDSDNLLYLITRDLNEAFNVDDLCAMERHILESLDFSIPSHSLHDFLDFYLTIMDADQSLYDFSVYLSYLCYYHHEFMLIPPSRLAFAVVLFAYSFGGIPPSNPFWVAELGFASLQQYSLRSVNSICDTLSSLLSEESAILMQKVSGGKNKFITQHFLKCESFCLKTDVFQYISVTPSNC